MNNIFLKILILLCAKELAKIETRVGSKNVNKFLKVMINILVYKL